MKGGRFAEGDEEKLDRDVEARAFDRSRLKTVIKLKGSQLGRSKSGLNNFT